MQLKLWTLTLISVWCSITSCAAPDVIRIETSGAVSNSKAASVSILLDLGIHTREFNESVKSYLESNFAGSGVQAVVKNIKPLDIDISDAALPDTFSLPSYIIHVQLVEASIIPPHIMAGNVQATGVYEIILRDFESKKVLWKAILEYEGMGLSAYTDEDARVFAKLIVSTLRKDGCL